MLRRGIDVRFRDYLRAQRASPLYGRVKVVNFEPKQHSVPDRRSVRIDQVRMIFRIPGVKLKNHLAGRIDALVAVAMRMLRERARPEQRRIPSTARPHIAHRDKRLRSGGRFSRGGFHKPLHLISRKRRLSAHQISRPGLPRSSRSREAPARDGAGCVSDNCARLPNGTCDRPELTNARDTLSE